MRRTIRTAISLGTFFVGTACSGGQGETPRAATRDSAGITIVETDRAAWEGADGWTVGAEPILSIGLTEGDPRYLFGKIAGVARMEDGRIAVADGQAHQIRFYDSEGRFLTATGRSGEGPGEFSSIGAMRRCGGDRIFVDDWQAVRTTILETDGELARIFRIFEPGLDRPRRPYSLRCSPGGSFVALGWGDLPDFRTMQNSAFYRQEAPVWVLDSIGAPVAELGTFPASERIFVRSPSGGGSSGPHPFGRQTSIEIGSERAYVATGDGLEVREFALEGRPLRILRSSADDLAIDESLISQYLTRDSAGAAAYLLRSANETGLVLPKELPATAALLLDTQGYVWARRFKHPWEDTERWGVFSPDGAFLGHVTMPPGLAVHEIDTAHVLGVSLDDLSVERVAMHPLLRGQ